MTINFPDPAPIDIQIERQVDIMIQRGCALPRWGWAVPSSYNGATGHERIAAWQKMIVAEGQTAKVYAYSYDELDLTTLSLIDPGVMEQLQGKSQLRVLAAESGTVLSGPLKEIGAGQVKVGGQTVPVTSYVWTLPEGEMRLDYGATGHLVRYTTSFAGRQITATLDAPPPERTWGAAGPVIGVGGGMSETEL